MDDLVSLLRILPDGLSVTAVIIVVILFLKHINDLQEKQQKILAEIKEGFKAEVQQVTSVLGTEFKEVQKDVIRGVDSLNTTAKDCTKFIERIAQALEKKA